MSSLFICLVAYFKFACCLQAINWSLNLLPSCFVSCFVEPGSVSKRKEMVFLSSVLRHWARHLCSHRVLCLGPSYPLSDHTTPSHSASLRFRVKNKHNTVLEKLLLRQQMFQIHYVYWKEGTTLNDTVHYSMLLHPLLLLVTPISC